MSQVRGLLYCSDPREPNWPLCFLTMFINPGHGLEFGWVWHTGHIPKTLHGQQRAPSINWFRITSTERRMCVGSWTGIQTLPSSSEPSAGFNSCMYFYLPPLVHSHLFQGLHVLSEYKVSVVVPRLQPLSLRRRFFLWGHPIHRGSSLPLRCRMGTSILGI